MIVQQLPEILTVPERIQGGSSEPLLNNTYNYLLGNQDNKTQKIDHDQVSNKMNVKLPWELSKVNIKKQETPQTLTELGVANQLRGMDSKAIESFKKANGLDPSFTPALRGLVKSSLKLGKIRDAEEALAKLSETLKTVSSQHELVLFRMAMYGASDAVFNELLELSQNNPKDSSVINSLGLYYLEYRSDIAKARDKFTESIRLNSKYEHPVNNLGVCFLREGKVDEGIKEFKKAIKISSRYVEAWENLANAYIVQKKFAPALEVLRAALSQHVQLSDYWKHQEGWLLIQLKQMNEAISWYKKKADEEPLNPLLRNNLGFCYEHLDHIDLAVEQYKSAIAINRNTNVDVRLVQNQKYLLPYYNLGRVLIRLEKNKEVGKLGDQLIRLKPNDSRGLFFQSFTLLHSGDFAQAEKLLVESIKQDGGMIDSYVNLSFIYEVIQEDYLKTIDLLKPLVKNGEKDSSIRNNYAYALIKNGDLAVAEKVLNTIKVSENPNVIATQGMLEIYKGSLSKGEALYEKAKEAVGKKDEDIVTQNFLYEKALFSIRGGEIETATKLLTEASSLPKSYMTSKITKILETIYQVLESS